MEFELSEEQLEMRRALRDFAEKEILPHAAEWDEKKIFPLETIKALGELGFLGVIFPPEYGGAGLKYVDYALVIEELARADESRAQGKEHQLVQYWIPLDRISESIVQAVRMGEDAAFFTHSGFDFHEIRESVRRNFERRAFARGASTITQQLAKNLFLTTEKSLDRKLKEAVLTHRLEEALSKNRILEIYLNVIEWGDGIYGIEAASRTYFGKSAAYLDPAEAAFLAAMIPNPRGLDPATRFESIKRGQERILRWMARAGFISEQELEAAKAKELPLRTRGPT